MVLYATAATAAARAKRTCPKCGHARIVPREKARETVTCRHCGAKMPPRKR